MHHEGPSCQRVDLFKSVTQWIVAGIIILDTPSAQNRFESTGILSAEIVREMAVVGPVARASGIPLDVRRDHPYGRYREVALEVPHFQYGDVLARARIRIEETRISARLIEDTLGAMPAGAIGSPFSRHASRRWSSWWQISNPCPNSL
jgi:NADH:ubiquinone oxidoreductase subunit D